MLVATNLCFQERNIFTQEVLCVVIDQLMEISPLPLLFMRTVLQSLVFHPKLLPFVLQILHKLIQKQVRSAAVALHVLPLPDTI